MIIEYNRPANEKEALSLLNRDLPRTLPLGGGTILSKSKEDIAVVDLQLLGLNQIKENPDHLLIGSMTTLESMLNRFGKTSAIGRAILIEAGKNIRGMATLGGALCSNAGRSALLTVLVALNVDLVWKPGDRVVDIVTWLGDRRSAHYGKYIASVRVPSNVKIEFESIGRSPLDQPVICCAISKAASGGVRIALGGFGETPVLAYSGSTEGNFLKGVDDCLKNSTDEWASAEYRSEIGAKLALRIMDALAESE